MTALLEDKVTAYLADHPDSTVEAVALALRARAQSVREVLASPFFECSEGRRRTKVYRLAAAPTATGRAGTGATHKARVLRLLSDGRPHSHMEGYRLGVMLHSRVSDLRKDGYRIECWRDGDDYLYRLVGRLEEAASYPAPGEKAASSSSPGRSDGLLTSPYQEQPGPLEPQQLSMTGPAFRRKAAA